MSKTALNQSPKASQALVDRALALGLNAKTIEISPAHYLEYGVMGSTSVPQKVVEIDGKRFSIGGARQYIEARERQNAPR